MAYLYSRLYTRMALWDRIKAYKDKEYFMPEIPYEHLAMYPPKAKQPSSLDVIPAAKRAEFLDFLHKYSKMHPDIDLTKQVNLDTALRFHKRQVFWRKRGLTEEAAYRKTADEYAPTFERERRFAGMIARAAKTTKAMTYMDHYEQLAHYEGLVKVKQLARDVNKFVRSQREQGDRGALDSWESLGVKVTQDPDALPETKSFIEKATALRKMHMERDDKFDGLRGLTDEMILWNAKDSSTAIYKSSKQLLKVLKNAGVRIRDDGTVDTRELNNAEVENAIERNPMVKILLKTRGEFDSYIRREKIERQPVKFSGSYSGTGKLIDWNIGDPYKRYYENIQPDQVETVEQRKQRLEEAFTARNPTEEEQLSLQRQAVDKLRDVRRKIDQILAKNGQEPLYSQQTKSDLMLDEPLNIGRMQEYLSVPEQDLLDTVQEQEQNRAIKFITTTQVLHEDTVNPFYDRDFSHKHLERPELPYTLEKPEKKARARFDDEIVEGLFEENFVDGDQGEQEPVESKKQSKLDRALAKLASSDKKPKKK